MNSQKGLELYSYLKNALGLPDNCVEVNIQLKQDELVLVSCRYYPSNAHEPVSQTIDMFPE